LMCGLLHFVQQGGAWVGCVPAQSPPRCTKCNSLSINGQCTNFILFTVALQLPLNAVTIASAGINYLHAWAHIKPSCCGQVLIVEFGSLAFSTAPLTIDQWLWCVLFGIGDLIWGQVFVCKSLFTILMVAQQQIEWSRAEPAVRTVTTHIGVDMPQSLEGRK